jgi:regulator of Ty1 transposition protein 103
MASKYSREQLVLKLRELTESQNSINTLSLWLLHHKKFAQDAAKVWFDELKKTKGSRQLILLYLANDVIQNGKRKGTVSEYIRTFQSVLVPAMAVCGKNPDPKTRPKIQRIIQIWESRAIFEIPFILALRQSLTSGQIIKPENTKNTRTAIEPKSVQEKENRLERIKNNRPISPEAEEKDSESDTEQPPNKVKKTDEQVQSMLSFLNSSTLDSDDEKEKSSIVPKSDLDLYPPNLDENQLLEIEKLTADSLIDLINNVQKDPPSFDSATRRRITELPREVQDPEAVKTLHQSGKLEPLLNVIEFGSEELNNYNTRLEEEIKQRQMLNFQLKLFKDKIDVEQKASRVDIKKLRGKIIEFQSTKVKLDKRIESLPDLSSLTYRKAKPLPRELNDLFS